MNANIRNIIVLCVVAGLATSCASLRFHSEGESVQFGIIQKHLDGTWELVQETRTIPLRLRATGFAFGYVYRPGNENEYSIHDVSYMPATPAMLSGEIGSLPVANATEGLKTPEYTMRGDHWMEYWFDEGDPPGDYRIDVFVNGRCVRSIEFRAVQDKGAPTTPPTVQ